MHSNSDGSRLLILSFRQRVCSMFPIATVLIVSCPQTIGFWTWSSCIAKFVRMGLAQGYMQGCSISGYFVVPVCFLLNGSRHCQWQRFCILRACGLKVRLSMPQISGRWPHLFPKQMNSRQWGNNCHTGRWMQICADNRLPALPPGPLHICPRGSSDQTWTRPENIGWHCHNYFY